MNQKIKQVIHHFVIYHGKLYYAIKFAQKFPFKQIRAYFRDKYITNIYGELKPVADGMPRGQVCVETTSLCNTTCSFCPHKDMEREKRIMDEKVFKETIYQIKKAGIKSIGLYYFGEPLTDPNLSDRIKYVKKDYPCYIQIVSNGLLLTEEKGAELIASDLDELLISLDATSQESYEKVRKGSFSTVVKNIKKFSDLKKQLLVKKPKLIVRIMVSQDNKEEVKEFVKIWKGKVDEVQYGKTHGFCENESYYWEKKLVTSPCLFLWTALIVLSNGDVTVCCMDYEGKLKLGNIMNRSLEEIWNCKMMQYYRTLHLKQEFPLICKTCDVNNSLITRWWNYE